MSFIVENEITIVGMFSQNGFHTIKIGAPVDIVFDNDPGRIYHAWISDIPKGVGQGQVATSGNARRHPCYWRCDSLSGGNFNSG